MSLELDALPAAQRTTHFPMDQNSKEVSHPHRGRVPREEIGTWGRDGDPATVPRQVERVQAGGTDAHERVLT